MGEIHLDSENLFYAFGWTPSRVTAEERARSVRAFDESFVPTTREDTEAVRSLGRASVQALAGWADAWFATLGTTRTTSMSYGKLDAGVVAVLDELRTVGFVHVVVDRGRDAAEVAMLTRIDGSGWTSSPLAIGSSDARVAQAVNENGDPSTGARVMLIVAPHTYGLRRHWFDSTHPTHPARFPRLRGYGVGYVALHLITRSWVEEQSRNCARRAALAAPPATPLTEESPDARWEAWSLYRFPHPSARCRLSSSDWIAACRRDRIPASIFRPLRDEVQHLYGDDFEVGDGPVAWSLACWAAAAVPMVRHRPTVPSDEEDGLRERAMRESWLRLMSR